MTLPHEVEVGEGYASSGLRFLFEVRSFVAQRSIPWVPAIVSPVVTIQAPS